MLALLCAWLATGAVAAAQPRSAPKVELTIPDDLSQPVSVTGTFQPRAYPTGFGASEWATARNADLVLHVPRKLNNLRVALLGAEGKPRVAPLDGYLQGNYSDGQEVLRHQRGDWAVWLSVRAEAKGTWTVVAWDGDKTQLDPTLRFGQPANDAPVLQRMLAIYAPYFIGRWCDKATGATAEAAHKLFTTLPRSFFVFAGSSDKGASAPRAGEPLLAIARGTDDVFVLMNDGGCHVVEARDLAIEPPGAPQLPAPRPLDIKLAKDHNNRYEDEPFLAVAEPAVVAAYREHKRTGWACYDREWDKLDPDQNASKLIVVTSQAGKVSKVEDLTTKFDRIAKQKCNMKPLFAERDRLEAKVLASLVERRKVWQREVVAHLTTLGLTFAEPASK